MLESLGNVGMGDKSLVSLTSCIINNMQAPCVTVFGLCVDPVVSIHLLDCRL